MAKGYSLFIGLNRVDPKYYAGWDGKLDQPENDVAAVMELADGAGFEKTILLSEMATREAVYGKIEEIGTKLKAGDLFLIYYSGHGGQVPDLDGDEDDGWDETWCLYNGQLIDDELHLLFSQYEQGVRVIVISDSCHSGTITKAMPWEEPSEVIEKTLPYEYIEKAFEENKELYVQIAERLMAINASEREVKASVLLIASCQDNQTSLAFRRESYSAFTTELQKCLQPEKMSYEKLHQEITIALEERLKKVGRMQTPNFFFQGEEYTGFKDQSFLQL